MDSVVTKKRKQGLNKSFCCCQFVYEYVDVVDHDNYQNMILNCVAIFT